MDIAASKTGSSGKEFNRLVDDQRNKFYKSYVKVLTIVKPKFFVMENVKRMLLEAIQVLEDFQQMGCNVSRRVLNAKDFGVPKNRERLILSGDFDFHFSQLYGRIKLQ